jgi:DNA-binding MarR family transcriptional regulator
MNRANNSLLSDIYFNLWVTMSRTRYAIFRLREVELKPYHVSPEQSAALAVIHGLNNQATPAEIARWLFRKPNTVSAMLKVMENKGLIKKSKDPYARNILRVSLTEKGEKAYQDTFNREAVYRIMSVLTQEECDCFQTCLDKMMAKAGTELGMEEKPISIFLGVNQDKLDRP